MRVLLFHALAGGDLGFPPGRAAAGPVDFEGAPDATGLDRRPLRKVFEGLDRAGTQVDVVALLATVNAYCPGDRPLAAYARRLAALMSSPDGLFGCRFEAGRVLVVEVAQPTMRDAVAPAGKALARAEATKCLVTSGSGSYTLGVGAVAASLEAGLPTTLVPVDDPGAAYQLAELIAPEERLRDWLVRHRFWAELADFDPGHRQVWRLLAARQRADTMSAERAVARGGVEGLDAGRLAKLTELWPAVQAAFFERAARGEPIDRSLARAWYTESLARAFVRDRQALPPPARLVLANLIEELTSRNTAHGGGTLIRRAAARLPSTTRGVCAAMVYDTELTDFYEATAGHSTDRLAPAGPLPETIVARARAWEGGDLLPRLLNDQGTTSWPVLGGGIVLVLMCVGIPPSDITDVERQDHDALRQVLAWAARHRDGPMRHRRILLWLSASAESARRAGELADWARPLIGEEGGAHVVSPLPTGPADVAEVRARVLAALRSGGLRDIDEIVLVAGPGKPVIGYGTIAAGVEWALTAACPVRLVELGRDQGVRSVLRDGNRAFGRLGADTLLADLAVSALQRLDLRMAWRLLGQGSSRLDSLRDEIGRLFRGLYGDPGPGSDRRAVARQRLTLVAHLLGAEPWPACYTAIETLRPGLFGWDTWKAVTAASPALRELERCRNATPYAHLLDRLRRSDRRHRVPPSNMRDLLARAVAELAPQEDQADDMALLHRHSALSEELRRFAAPSP